MWKRVRSKQKYCTCHGFVLSFSLVLVLMSLWSSPWCITWSSTLHISISSNQPQDEHWQLMWTFIILLQCGILLGNTGCRRLFKGMLFPYHLIKHCCKLCTRSMVTALQNCSTGDDPGFELPTSQSNQASRSCSWITLIKGWPTSPPIGPKWSCVHMLIEQVWFSAIRQLYIRVGRWC